MTEHRRTLRILVTGNVLQAAGLQLFVPILPIYLRMRGSSNQLIGMTIACGIAGYGLAQFPSGVLADRFNRRTVLVGGMAVYAALFLVYLAPIPVVILPLVRLLHAAIGGVYSVASVAMLGDITPESRRGRVFGQWQAATRSGFLVGPLIGGVIATVDVSIAFVGAAVIYGVATAIMLLLPTDSQRVIRPGPAMPSGRIFLAVLPLVGIAAAGDYGAGAFNAIWSLWLSSSGATPWQIGVSFCLFALPSVALSAVLGAATDRRGPRMLVVVSLLGLALVAPLCAMRVGVASLTLFGVLVGLFCTPNRPVVVATASRRFVGPFAARAQGSLQGGLMGVQFFAALFSGVLLSLSPTLAFGALSVVAAVSLAVVLRNQSAFRSGP